MKMEWWMFVIGAVVSWGVYVPVLHEGQVRMGRGDLGGGALRAFLCVGLAYFLTGVVIPLIVLSLNLAGGETLNFNDKEGSLKTSALTFATLGGIAGAAGALCIIFSIKQGGSPMYVAPLVFAGAPIVNAIVSLIWHPEKVRTFSEATPGWMMFTAGILLAALGAGLVLYSKSEIEVKNASLNKAPVLAVTQRAVAPETGVQGPGNT